MIVKKSLFLYMDLPARWHLDFLVAHCNRSECLQIIVVSHTHDTTLQAERMLLLWHHQGNKHTAVSQLKK